MIWFAGWYFLVSLVTFTAYGLDKRKARLSYWRIKENTLHCLESLGGWPGGLAAQRYFHHKTKKTKFQVIFWGIVAMHLGAWAWWICLRFR